MSNLLKLISEWKKSLPEKESESEANFQDLFRSCLHQPPYCLRYALDKKRENLFLIYQTDNSDQTNEVVKECNGIILDKRDFHIVAYGMRGRLDETENYYSGQSQINLENYDIEEGDDGAVLTVYNFENEWIVATKRSIDASRVRWSSSRNFVELLGDALPNPLDVFKEYLDSDYTYSFVLLHPENHLVLLHQTPEVIFVSKRNNKTLEEFNVSTENGGNPCIFPWAKERKVLSVEECLKKLQTKNRLDKRGIILCTRGDKTCIDRIKIDFKWFHEADLLRKGLPSLHLSYLACSPEEKQKMRGYFGNLMEFALIDNLLGSLVRYVFAVYRDSYVRKQYRVPVNHPIYRTLRILHYEYKMTGEPVRIHHVAALIDRTPVNILDGMLKFFSTYGFRAPPEHAIFHNGGNTPLVRQPCVPNVQVQPSAPSLSVVQEAEMKNEDLEKKNMENVENEDDAVSETDTIKANASDNAGTLDEARLDDVVAV